MILVNDDFISTIFKSLYRKEGPQGRSGGHKMPSQGLLDPVGVLYTVSRRVCSGIITVNPYLQFVTMRNQELSWLQGCIQVFSVIIHGVSHGYKHVVMQFIGMHGY